MLSRVKLIAEPWDIGSGRLPGRQLPAAVSRVERQVPRRHPPLLEGRREPGLRGWLSAGRLGRPLSGRPAPAAGQRQLHHRARRLHAARPGHLRQQAQRGQRRAQSGRRRRQPVLEPRRRRRDRRPEIIALRERQKRNMLATLFLSQGVPMLLGGDEMGRTQRGNNNAYCQDNELSWFDWKLDDRGASLLEFTTAPDRAAPAPSGRCSTRVFLWATSSGTRSSRTWPGCAPTASEMTPEDWQKPWISSLGFMLGGDAIRMLDDQRPARGRRRPAGADERAPRAGHVPAAVREGGTSWLLEMRHRRSEQAVARLRRRVRGWRVGRWWSSASRSRRRRPVKRPPRRRALAPAGGAAAPPARRRGGAAVLDPVPAGLGSGRHRGHPALRRLGRAELASRCCSSCRSTRSRARIPAPTRRSRRSRSIRSICRSTHAATSWRRVAATRCQPKHARSSKPPPERRSSIGPPSAPSRTRASTLAFAHFLHEEWNKKRARAPVGGLHAGQSRAGSTTTRCSPSGTSSSAQAGSIGRAGRAIAIRRRLTRLRDKHRDALLRAKWAQWQLDLQWRKARRQASALGVDLMGDLPFMVGVDSADVWSNRELFRTDRTWARRPTTARPKGRTGVCRSTTGTPSSVTTSPGSRRARCAQGLCSARIGIDHAIGFYRTYFRSLDGKHRRVHSRRRARAGSTRRAHHAHHEPLGRGRGRGSGRGAAVPATVAGEARRAGYRVLRWEKDGDRVPRSGVVARDSVATNATHDTDTTAAWYDALAPDERDRLRDIPVAARWIRQSRSTTDARDLFLRAIYRRRRPCPSCLSRTRWAGGNASTPPGRSNRRTGR